VTDLATLTAVPTFTRDEIDAIRCYCTNELRDEVARIAVVERDHGACIGVIVEIMDGRRLAVAAVASGDNDSEAGKLMVDMLRLRIAALRKKMN
jgi:hypothetical protein